MEPFSAPDMELLLVQACGFGRVNHPLGLPFTVITWQADGAINEKSQGSQT